MLCKQDFRLIIKNGQKVAQLLTVIYIAKLCFKKSFKRNSTTFITSQRHYW